MAMHPAKAADAARVAKTPRTVLLTVSSFDRQPLEARTKVLMILTAPLGATFPPAPPPVNRAVRGSFDHPSPSCPQGALSGDGPCALAVTKRMKETVSRGKSGTAGHVQPEARATTSVGFDRQCSPLRPLERSMMITMP